MIFKVEYNDPEAGWITVAAGDFTNINEAIETAKPHYNTDMIRIKPGTEEDLEYLRGIALECEVCGGPLGMIRRISECKYLACDSCGAEYTYKSKEPYHDT